MLARQRQVNRIGELELDLGRGCVRYAGTKVKLAGIEYRIIAFLMINAGAPVTYRMLAEEGLSWTEYDELYFPKLCSILISRIDKKLANAGVGRLRQGAERRPVPVAWRPPSPHQPRNHHPGRLCRFAF
jgi:DNA-binding response OmpR family regulator